MVGAFSFASAGRAASPTSRRNGPAASLGPPRGVLGRFSGLWRALRHYIRGGTVAPLVGRGIDARRERIPTGVNAVRGL